MSLALYGFKVKAEHHFEIKLSFKKNSKDSKKKMKILKNRKSEKIEILKSIL